MWLLCSLTICPIESAIMDETANNTTGISKSIFDLRRCRIFLLSHCCCCCCCCISSLFVSAELFCLFIFWLLLSERDRRVDDEGELAAPLLLAIVCFGCFVYGLRWLWWINWIYVYLLDASNTSVGEELFDETIILCIWWERDVQTHQQNSTVWWWRITLLLCKEVRFERLRSLVSKS